MNTIFNSSPGRLSKLRRPAAATMSFALLAYQALPAIPAITNDATSSGTYGGNPVTSNTSSQSVPVTAAGPTLTVAKSGAAPVDVNADGIISVGDTITYTYVVTNNGNVSISNVLPVDAGPTFNSIAADNALGAFQTSPAGPVTLAPTQNRTFTAVYTLTAQDADRAAGITIAGGNAVQNSATATGTPATGTLAAVTPSAVELEIPANPKLVITKAVQTGPAGGTADVGETITYLYTVQNTGNVTIAGAQVNDVHEGAAVPLASLSEGTLVTDGPLANAPDNLPSTDTASTPGVWTTLRPGATVTFTYTHTVTQAEVDAG
jgi:plastocyanin